MTDVKSILEKIKAGDYQNVDFCFTDPRGKWQHLTYHVTAVDEDLLADGVMFDGSSITGWKDINESDMLLRPRAETAVNDPFAEKPTLMLICDVIEPRTGEHYGRGPRGPHAEALVKLLGHGHGALGRETQFASGFLLHGASGEGRGWPLADVSLAYFGDLVVSVGQF